MHKILFVGGGGIGGITAAHMSEKGYNVTLYDIDEQHVKKIQKDGLFIDGVKGKKTVHLNATTKLEGNFDIVFLAVKSQHTKTALENVLPYLKKDAPVVSLQNSINEELIAEKIGVDRTIGAVIGWGATNIAPGHLRQTTKGNFVIGRLDGRITPQLKEIKKMLESLTTVEITTNIMGHLWTKLIINCINAPLGAIFGVELKNMVTNKKTLPIMAALADELVRFLEYLDVKPENFENMLTVDFFKIDTLNDYKRVVMVLQTAGKQRGDLKSTMLQDIEKGRKTEIDYINGYVEKKAKKLGVATPVNGVVINMVKEIEAGKRKPSLKNADDLYKRVRIPKAWKDYDFEKDKYAEFTIFNLPLSVKHEQTITTAGVYLIGLTTAFAQAFSRLTNSFIGKIFVRKNEWEIANLVLSKFLENMGEKFAELVATSYSLEMRDSRDMTKILILYLNNFNMSFSIKKLSPKETELVVSEETKCPYVEAAKKAGVEEKIEPFVCKHFYDGISKAMKRNVSCECITGKCKKNGVCEFVINMRS